jgi:hypothetical protein
MSTNNTTANNKTISPYTDRDFAIRWLREKGIKVADVARIYHTMSFEFQAPMTTGRELDLVLSFGRIALIDFENRVIHVFTAADNVMEIPKKETVEAQ